MMDKYLDAEPEEVKGVPLVNISFDNREDAGNYLLALAEGMELVSLHIHRHKDRIGKNRKAETFYTWSLVEMFKELYNEAKEMGNRHSLYMAPVEEQRNIFCSNMKNLIWRMKNE